MTTMSPGARTGRRTCSTSARKLAPLIGPSMTQGAVSRSHRNAARKVSVCHLPKGALATRRAPLAHRPWERVMLVFAQVSSMNTSRLGSIVAWRAFHRSRRLATSGRSCSEARRLFFERHAFMVKKMPERIIADHQAAVGQLLEQSPQREIRLLGDPRQNPIPLARHKVRPVAAHFQRSRTANGALSLRPLHNAGDADHERLGHRPAGLARRHSPNHPLPQVQRIGSSHPSWPPIKSQQVESDSRPFGNAPRFSQSRSRSSVAIVLAEDASHIVVVPRSDSVTISVPSPLKAITWIGAPSRVRVAIALPSVAFQTSTRLSSDAVAMRVPSGLKVTDDPTKL